MSYANPYIIFSRSRSAISGIADAVFAEAVRLHDECKRLAFEASETRRLYKFGQFHLVKPEDVRTAADVEAAEAAAETASKAETRAVLRSDRLEALLRRGQTGYEFTLEAEGDCGGGSYVVHWYIWLDGEEPSVLDWDSPDEILWLPSEPDPDDPDDGPDDPEPVLVGGSDWYACH